MDNLEGRVATITGAGSGIGRGIALALARCGVHVALADVDVDGIASVAEEVRALGVQAIDVPTDVRDPAAVEALAVATVERLGAVHIVCNNAGVSTMGRQWELTQADWDWVLAVCLNGVVHGVRSFVPRILESGGGHVANTASMGGLLTSPYLGPYAAAKHGVVGLSKGLRAELAGTGVGVSVVCPGHVQTGLLGSMRRHMEESGSLTPAAGAVLDSVAAGQSEGMSSEDAGEVVVDGIRNDRFWILPNGAEHLPSVLADVEELKASV